MNKELYKLGSTSKDRNYSLVMIMRDELIPRLLDRENIDTCFRIREIASEAGKFDFRIDEIQTSLEIIKVPKFEYMPFKSKFSFIERIKILFTGKI